MSLWKHVASLGRKPSASQKCDLLECRHRLRLRLSAFERKSSAFMLLDDDTQWTRVTGEVAGDIDSDNDESNDTSDDEGVGEVTVHLESRMVSLPSSLVPGEIQRLGLTTIAGQEEKLR